MKYATDMILMDAFKQVQKYFGYIREKLIEIHEGQKEIIQRLEALENNETEGL